MEKNVCLLFVIFDVLPFPGIVLGIWKKKTAELARALYDISIYKTRPSFEFNLATWSEIVAGYVLGIGVYIVP